MVKLVSNLTSEVSLTSVSIERSPKLADMYSTCAKEADDILCALPLFTTRSPEQENRCIS